VTRTAFSVDPGGAHVGLALWHEDGDRWVLDTVDELTPDFYLEWVESSLRHYDLGAIEIFRLGSPREAMAQRGSDFPTVELIGVTKTAATRARVELLLTDRTKKKSALARIAVRAPGGRVPGRNQHCRDAVSVLVSATALPIARFSFDQVLP
jgi:hypothetical protein